MMRSVGGATLALLLSAGTVLSDESCAVVQQSLDTVAEQYPVVLGDGGKRPLGLAMIAMRATAALQVAEQGGWEPEAIAAYRDLQSAPAFLNNGKDRFEDVGPQLIAGAAAVVAELAPNHCPDLTIPDLPAAPE
jgi:hypothetical protein